MSNYEPQDGDTSIFRNEKKTTDKHPDYTGYVWINGEKRRLAYWLRQGKNGQQFLSGKLSNPDPPQGSLEVQGGLEDLLPF